MIPAIYLLGLPVTLPKHFLKCLPQFSFNFWSHGPTTDTSDQSETGMVLAKINKRVKHAQDRNTKYVLGRASRQQTPHVIQPSHFKSRYSDSPSQGDFWLFFQHTICRGSYELMPQQIGLLWQNCEIARGSLLSY